MSKLAEQRVDSQELFKGGFLHAFRDQVRLPNGQLTQREYVVHPGAVMIVPLLEAADGAMQLVLERQYRYPVQQEIIEFPAGKLDPGEDTLACAQRELREEPEAELEELAKIYRLRGLDPALARQVAEQLTAHDALAGRGVRVHDAASTWEAQALGIADDGALRVRTGEGHERRVHAADVSVRA